MIAKKALGRQMMAVRSFALNTSHLQAALRDPEHQNWAQFFQGVRAADVAGSDTQQIASLLKVLTYAGESHEAQEQKELYKAVDEYFRLKFRKLSGRDAFTILAPLGEDSNRKLSVLDDKFWVWETLDEALRPIISEISEDEVLQLCRAFAANYKGSEDIWDYLMMRVHYHGATVF